MNGSRCCAQCARIRRTEFMRVIISTNYGYYFLSKENVFGVSFQHLIPRADTDLRASSPKSVMHAMIQDILLANMKSVYHTYSRNHWLQPIEKVLWWICRSFKVICKNFKALPLRRATKEFIQSKCKGRFRPATPTERTNWPNQCAFYYRYAIRP